MVTTAKAILNVFKLILDEIIHAWPNLSDFSFKVPLIFVSGIHSNVAILLNVGAKFKNLQ